jgi:hypothetical protein
MKSAYPMVTSCLAAIFVTVDHYGRQAGRVGMVPRVLVVQTHTTGRSRLRGARQASVRGPPGVRTWDGTSDRRAGRRPRRTRGTPHRMRQVGAGLSERGDCVTVGHHDGPSPTTGDILVMYLQGLVTRTITHLHITGSRVLRSKATRTWSSVLQSGRWGCRR